MFKIWCEYRAQEKIVGNKSERWNEGALENYGIDSLKGRTEAADWNHWTLC